MFAAFVAALVSMQPTSASAQFVPRLNLCLESIESENWRVVASDTYYEIYPSIVATSGRTRNPDFSIHFSDTGRVRYSLKLSPFDTLTSYENHYVYADGELLLAARHNERSNGNRRAVGFLPDAVLERMKSARNVEISITRNFTGEPERPRGSVSLDLRGLSAVDPIGQRLMEILKAEKLAGRCN